MEKDRVAGQNGKDGDRRLSSNPWHIDLLRDELWRTATSKKRKKEIETLLEEYENEKAN